MASLPWLPFAASSAAQLEGDRNGAGSDQSPQPHGSRSLPKCRSAFGRQRRSGAKPCRAPEGPADVDPGPRPSTHGQGNAGGGEIASPAGPVATRAPGTSRREHDDAIPGLHDGRPAGAALASAIVGARGAGLPAARCRCAGRRHPWTGTCPIPAVSPGIFFAAVSAPPPGIAMSAGAWTEMSAVSSLVSSFICAVSSRQRLARTRARRATVPCRPAMRARPPPWRRGAAVMCSDSALAALGPD
jgi:hypothetical protein